MTVADAWMSTKGKLQRSGIQNPSLEAEILIRRALNIERSQFYAVLKDTMQGIETRAIDSMLQRRLNGEPLSYITETREFYGLELYVNSDVLVPRQETELLIDTILTLTKGSSDRQLILADVGTGSGAIAVAIGHHLPHAVIYAIDLSRKALRVADINRMKHHLSNRVKTLKGDLLKPLPKPVDMIIANLPYLKAEEMAELPPDVSREPPTALDGGTDGLRMISRLLDQAPSYLRPGGWLLLEINPQLLEPVIAMGQETFPNARVSYKHDLLGLARAVIVEMRGNYGEKAIRMNPIEHATDTATTN